MREALLSAADVHALARDLREHAQIQGTLCKAGPRQQTSAADTPLEVALERLLAHAVPAIQIRYVYDGHEWTDTLITAPGGVRLVRCRH